MDAAPTLKLCPANLDAGRPVFLDVALSCLTLHDVALSHCLAVTVGCCLALLDVAVCSGLDLFDVLYLGHT